MVGRKYHAVAALVSALAVSVLFYSVWGGTAMALSAVKRELDPIELDMIFNVSAARIGDPVSGDAFYRYVMPYPIPIRICYDVELDGKAEQPTVIQTKGDLPMTIVFTNSSDVDLLDNIGYTYGWRYHRCQWVMGIGVYEILYVTRAYHLYHTYYGAVGDPTGPDFLEDADYDSFFTYAPGALAR